MLTRSGDSLTCQAILCEFPGEMSGLEIHMEVHNFCSQFLRNSHLFCTILPLMSVSPLACFCPGSDNDTKDATERFHNSCFLPSSYTIPSSPSLAPSPICHQLLSNEHCVMTTEFPWGGEKVQWDAQLAELEDELIRCPQYTLFAAIAIEYLSALSPKHRQVCFTSSYIFTAFTYSRSSLKTHITTPPLEFQSWLHL